MEKFGVLTGTAAPLPLKNIDTDMIIPAQFLKTIKRTGLGKVVFFRMRFDDKGAEIPEFILNQDPFRDAKIIVAGDNFGCGSSREHAPWALADFGIRCVISTSFADIFFNNSCKNGLLPIALDAAIIDKLFEAVLQHEGYQLDIDLIAQTVITPQREVIAFEFNAGVKQRLLEGLDDIGASLKYADDITAYEASRRASAPWLFV